MIRVLIAAASVVTRAGLEALVTTNPELTVIGSVSGVSKLAQQIETLQPDVVLLELESSEPVAETLFTLDAELLNVVVLVDIQSDQAVEMFRSGIQGILSLEATADEILTAVEAAAAGLVVLHPDFIDSLLPSFSPATQVLPPIPNQALTPREVEVLGMLAEGLGNKGIARRLNISEHTVKFHVSSIFSKLNVSSRTEAVTLGARQGLILL